MPAVDVSKLSEKVNISEAEDTLPVVKPVDVEPSDIEEKKVDAYAVIAEKNVFSPQRKEWVVKVVVPNPSELAKNEKLAQKKSLAVKPKKIVLHGIVMAGDMRKALISNPLTGVSNKKTLYVEEGEELEGYMVTSIESDLIRLDWQGEEIIVTLYSGVSDSNQAGNSGNKYDEGTPGHEQRRKSGTSKMEYKYKEVEEQHAEVDTDVVNEKADDSFAEISDKIPINLMSMDPENLFMPAIDGAKLYEVVEKREFTEKFPDIESGDVDFTVEEQKIVKTETPNSVDLEEDAELKMVKASSEKPRRIVLHGIVIAGDIKKALINIPVTDVSGNKSLYVEEGDILEGYMVTSIEPDRLRLDLQGKERVVTFPPL